MAKTNQQIIVTEGDFGVEILTQFIDTNKKPVPIEGCSCKIKFSYDGNVISEKTGVVIDEPKGIVSVILDKEETQYSGLWTSYWICYDQFNNVTTTENIYYYVQPSIGSVNNPAFTELLNYYNRDEVNDMFKNILEQLNNYTLSKNDVEEYIKFYVQDKVDDDFVRQCILDAIGNASDYAKKQDVTAVSNNLNALSQRVDRYNNSLEQEDTKINTKINTNMETVNTKFESINARIDTSLHNITTNRDSINEIRTKMVTREDINSITRFDITEINSMLKVNEAFNNTKVLLSNGIVNFNCRLEDKTSHNNIPFNQNLFKIPIEFLPNCSYMFLDCKYGLFGKSPTFSGTVKIDCETGTAMLETDGNLIDNASISYIGAITIQATWYRGKITNKSIEVIE